MTANPVGWAKSPTAADRMALHLPAILPTRQTIAIVPRGHCADRASLRASWPNRRNAYSPDFQTYLAQTTPPADIGALSDIFERAPA